MCHLEAHSEAVPVGLGFKLQEDHGVGSVKLMSQFKPIEPGHSAEVNIGLTQQFFQ